MKYRTRSQIVLSILIAFILVALPLRVIALEETPLVETAGTPVIITEVQTGGATASDEFIELYNNSNEPVDITGWEIRVAAADTANDETTLLVTIGPESTTLPGRSYFVLHTSAVVLPAGTLGQQYSAGLTKNDKTVAVFARDETACQMTVQDAVAWENTPGTTQGEGRAVPVPAMAVSAEKLLERYMDADGTYVDTDNNIHDFRLTQGTPGQDNPFEPGEITEGSASSLQPFPAAGCEELPANPPTNPNEDLENPIITEILPNPGPPLADAEAEYIELYNPNDAPFDLSGYTLEAGITTTYQFAIPQDTVLEPRVYTAFFSKDTKIALSNSGGQVRLKKSVEIIDETSGYSAASNGHAWALIGDTWQWTATLTPNAANKSTPGEDPDDPSGDESQEDPGTPNQGLMPPQITELLPNPGAPKTDQQDEFIELYNPNDAAFDLSNYVLEAGLTSKYRYTFPAGTTLQPQSYMAFFSVDTG